MPNPWKVMIVDDDPTVHKLITKKLTAENYEVRSVFESPKAIDIIKQAQPDLVILDLMMPHMSGIEICRAMKQDHETSHILVLILSAKETQDDRIRGLQLGADDYISKPFHLATLTRKIEYMLGKKVAANG